MLKAWLTHPLVRGVDIDDPRATALHRQLIREKRFLRMVYEEWYGAIASRLEGAAGPVLELGGGGGFLKDRVPDLISSEVFPCTGIDAVLDGQRLPFADAALQGIVMTDVLHHIPQSRRLFAEAARCVRTGGTIVMIEPWVTAWSQLVYGKLHHEPFRPEVTEWEFPSSGPLSSANGALPWMIFRRDRDTFEHEFPEWEVESIKPMMPFRYLLSGGVSMRGLVPAWSFGLWRLVEAGLSPLMGLCAMFAQIVLVRVEASKAD